MEKTNLLTLVITLTVGIILAGSLLMPVIANAQEGVGPTTTFTNTGYGQVYVTEVTEDTTLVYDGTTLTINATDIATFGSRCSFTADTAFMYHGSSGSKIFAWTGTSYENPSFTEYTATIDVDDKTITVVGMVDSVETTIECPYTWCYVTAAAGDYLSIDSNFARDYYIRSIDDVKSVEYNNSGFVFSSNGAVLEVNGTEQGTVNYTVQDVSGYNIQTIHVEKTIANSGLSYTYNDNNYSVHWTIVPYKVTGNELQDLPARELLSVIPILIVVALVVGATGAVFVKRED